MPRSDIMLAYPFEEKRLEKWFPPYIVQPKLDGERCRAVCGGSDLDNYIWLLLSSEKNIINSVPHIEKAITEQIEEPIELDGELYIHGAPFEDIHSIVGRTVNISPDFEAMEYHIFDIVNSDPQYIRLMDLKKIKETLRPPLRIVDHEICETLDEVMRAYDKFLELGYEGIIVRHFEAPYVRKRSTSMMKFKPKKQDIYRVIGYKEEISIEGVPKNRLGALNCIALDGGESFSVGSGLSDENRELMWRQKEELIGKMILVGYQHITTGHKVPRFPVFMKLISEVDLSSVGGESR